jgi:hypothetical protein
VDNPEIIEIKTDEGKDAKITLAPDGTFILLEN